MAHPESRAPLPPSSPVAPTATDGSAVAELPRAVDFFEPLSVEAALLAALYSLALATLARRWPTPGVAGFEHRIGGIERDYDSGNISYDPANHQRMTEARWDKVLRVADDLPEQACEDGAAGAQLAVVGWGSTFGPIARAVANAPRILLAERWATSSSPISPPSVRTRRCAALAPYR